MAKYLESGASYAGRRADVAVINCSVDRETAILLRQYAGARKLGALVSRARTRVPRKAARAGTRTARTHGGTRR